MWKADVRDLTHFIDLCGVFSGMWIFVDVIYCFWVQ